MLQQQPLPIRPNAQWVYKVHTANGWELVRVDDDAYEWLPRLQQLHFKPGCNGVKTVRQANGQKMIEASTALADDRQRGFVHLMQHGQYRHSYPTVNGGQYYCAKWATPVVKGRKVRFRVDRQAQIDYRRSLLETGRVTVPDREWLEDMIEAQRRACVRLEGMLDRPATRAKYNAAVLKLAAMEQGTPGERIRVKDLDLSAVELSGAREAAAQSKVLQEYTELRKRVQSLEGAEEKDAEIARLREELAAAQAPPKPVKPQRKR